MASRDELRDKTIQKHYAERTVKEEYASADTGIADLLKEANLEKRASIPERVPDLYQGTGAAQSPVNRLDFPMSQLLRDEEPYLFEPSQTYGPEQQAWARQFTDAFETAYYYHQGNVPFEWLLEQDPKDIELLRTGDYAIDSQVWDNIQAAAEPYQEQERYRRLQEEEFNQRVDAKTQGNIRLVGFLENLKFIPGVGQELRDIEAAAGQTVFSTDLIDRDALRESVRKDLIQEGVEDSQPPTNEGIWNTIGNALGGTIEWVGGQIDQTLQHLTPRTSVSGGVAITEEQREEDFRQSKIQDIEALYGSDTALIEAGKSAGFVTAQQFWQDEETMNEIAPGFRDEWIARYGGDIRVAGLMYAGAVTDSMEVEDQLDLGEQIHEERIKILEEEDFQLSGATLNTLAMYDRLVPSTMLTGSLLLLSDRDLQRNVVNGEMGKFYDAIKDVDRRPSAVFGLENSATGLALDLTGSWLFDPINWLFAPAGAKNMGRARNAQMVENSLSSGTARLRVDDIIQAGIRGEPGLQQHVTNFITEVNPSLADEARSIINKAIADPAIDDVASAVRGSVEDVVRRALLQGADMGNVRRMAVHSAMGSKISAAARSGHHSVIRRNMQPFRTTSVHIAKGPQAYKRAYENIHYVWGENVEKSGYWTGRLQEARQGQVARVEQMLDDADFHRLDVVSNQLDNLDNNMRLMDDFVDDIDPDDLIDTGIHMEETKAALELEQARTLAGLKGKYGTVQDSAVQDVVREMWDDYNKEVIAKNPAWKDKVITDPESPMVGMVPWDDLKIGGIVNDNALSPSLEGLTGLDELADVQKLNKQMQDLYGGDGARTFSTPVSPMDLVVAGSATGSRYVQYMQETALGAVRQAAQTAHRLWVMDKIARISTAAVVSWDELYRIFHRYGHEAAVQYMSDRAMFMAARARAVMHEARINKSKGIEYASDSSRKRMQDLLDIPDYITEAERLTWSKSGQGIGVIRKNDPGYTEAAREFYRGFTTQPAFQAALKGEDEFRSWWTSSGNTAGRKGTVTGPDGPGLAGWKDYYDGQQTIIRALMRNVPADKQGMVMKAIREAADDAAAGGRGYMPVEAFKYTDSVRGFQKAGFDNGKNLIGRGTDMLLDKFFMEPTNYRRGLLFNMSKEKELDRLIDLYTSQGKKVLTNKEALRELNLPSHSSLSQLPPDLFDQLATKRGLVTMRHLENIAESRAMDELQDMFFAWDQGSRLGNQGRAIAPFIGPWADMWGFWGREMLSSPILRGEASNSAFLQSLQRKADRLPVNPKTGSAISRLANTDFSITEGWAGEGGPDMDLSPLFFFPTQGENAFSTLIPGLGVIPSFVLDMIGETYDPLEDPEGYQRYIDNVSQILPSVQYTTGDLRSDILGGGNIASLYKVGAGLASMWEGNWASSAWLGDYSADIDMNRNVSATFATEIHDLLAITDPDRLQMEIMGIVHAAKSKAGAQQAGQNAVRFTVPLRVDFDHAAEELQQVWVDWAKDTGFEVRPDLQGADLSDPELLRQYADDVRSGFFQMSPEERDLAVLRNPQLAVNLVSNWKWSNKGKDTLSRETVISPYRSGGSKEDLARHQTYVERGLIEPINPTDRAYLILGTISHARKNVVKAAYAETAQSFNDYTWAIGLTPENKGRLSFFLDTYGHIYGMGPGDERRLWERWGSYENDFEGQLAADMGLDPESEEFKDRMSRYNIPKKQRAWSTSWTGTSGPSMTYGEFPVGLIPQSDENLERFSSLGVEWDDELTGDQIWQGLINEYQVSPGYNAEVDGPYAKWLDDASAGPSAAENGLLTMAANDIYDDDFRARVTEFRILEAETAEKERNRGIPLRSEIDQVRTAYRNLMILSGEEGAMTTWWEDSFERRYGPLDWEPPVPKSPFDAEGNLVSGAYQPIVRKVRDGDTLLVENKQKSLFGETDDGLKSIRLLGVRARDFGLDDEGAIEDRQTLVDLLLDARRNGDKIYLVRDPEQLGSSTDMYGRELAWLYIGEEPFYSESAFIPGED